MNSVLICSRNGGKLKRAAQQLEQASGRIVRWFAAEVTRAASTSFIASVP